MRSFVPLIAGLAGGLLAMPAMAVQGNAAQGLQEMRELNLIVLGDMSGGHDVEGKTFVGGSLANAATYGLGRSNQGFLASSAPTLTVGGSLGGNANINNGNNGAVAHGVAPAGAEIGGNAGTINLNADDATLFVGGNLGNSNGGNGATIVVGGALQGNQHPTAAFVSSGAGALFANAITSTIAAQDAQMSADLKALSASLAGLATTTGSAFNTSDPNNVKLTAVDGGHGFAVINITDPGSAFNDVRNLVFNIPTVTGGGYLPTIVNIAAAAGSTINLPNANSNNSAYNPYVLWNFEQAATVNFGTQFNGSVLAPYATISNHTPIEGSVAVAGFNQGGEVHLGTFAGGGANTTAFAHALGLSVAAVPEPASWATMVLGFGLAGGAIRRRRAPARPAA